MSFCFGGPGDGGGCCVHVPRQDNIPKAAKVKSCAAAESDEWVWLWMGDREKADLAVIPMDESDDKDSRVS